MRYNPPYESHEDFLKLRDEYDQKYKFKIILSVPNEVVSRTISNVAAHLHVFYLTLQEYMKANELNDTLILYDATLTGLIGTLTHEMYVYSNNQTDIAIMVLKLSKFKYELINLR